MQQETTVVDETTDIRTKRSEAAKKAAATRKANAEAERKAEARTAEDRYVDKPKSNWTWLPWLIALVLAFLLFVTVIFWPRATVKPVAAVAQPTAVSFNVQVQVVMPTAVPVEQQTAPVVQPTATPTAAPIVYEPTAVPVSNDSPAAAASVPGAYTFSAPGNQDTMPKTSIELASLNTWFHRVFNERLFHAPNWDGADSWFVTLNLGSNSGGNWTSMGNPGQIVYRGTSTHISWCLGVLTTSQWKSQFMAGSTAANAGINVRIAPQSVVTVVTASGKTIQQATSDIGDITVILPDSGVVTICVDYDTAAPTGESLVWWGPYDRSEGINTIDAQ